MDSKLTRSWQCWGPWLILTASLIATGCDSGEVRAYRVPKDPPPSPAAAAPMAAEGGPPRVQWKLPSGWQELPAGQMRVGHFAVKGEGGKKAQVTIIPLGGQGGGDLENVNRWRSQVSLPRLSETEMEAAAEKVEIAGASGRLFDFTGVPPEEDQKVRLLSAVLHREGTAWFFKMLGDDDLVAAQKPAFVEFLKSVSFEAGAAPAGPADPGGKVTAVDAAAAPAAAPGSPRDSGMSAGHPVWQVPEGWQTQPPGSMQLAKFAVAGRGGGKAEVTVVVLPGDAGGVIANVNRWRGQIGLPALAEAEVQKLIAPLEAAGSQAYVVDLVAESTERRMVAVGVARQGQSWFYKLVGDGEVVGDQKEAFLKFVKGVRYGS